MKNYRILERTTQYIAADRCEVTGDKIIFYAAGKVAKTVETANTRAVEELDNRMKRKEVIFSNSRTQRHTPQE